MPSLPGRLNLRQYDQLSAPSYVNSTSGQAKNDKRRSNQRQASGYGQKHNQHMQRGANSQHMGQNSKTHKTPPQGNRRNRTDTDGFIRNSNNRRSRSKPPGYGNDVFNAQSTEKLSPPQKRALDTNGFDPRSSYVSRIHQNVTTRR